MSRLMRVRGGLWLALGLSMALLTASALGASASGIYATGTTGYDVSYPNCGSTLPASGAFGIVGATGGRAYTANTCLASELGWAATLPAPPSAYMNLNYAIGSTASNGDTGPAGTCGRKDRACVAYNYGYNAAAYAATLVPSSVTISTWWLDIETSNSWSSNPSLNADVIKGAVDYLHAQGATVGIYSTAAQWTKIAGSYAPGLPNWVAGALASSPGSYCGASHAFGGGPVWLTQYSSNGFDGDYAC
ncbi:MAG TPA: hypothetical protein VMU89_25435 [Thermomicrobiaceae bacterium]|nr:hypothetical protein [Thermomicrobiaceae bacterium]